MFIYLFTWTQCPILIHNGSITFGLQAEKKEKIVINHIKYEVLIYITPV